MGEYCIVNARFKERVNEVAPWLLNGNVIPIFARITIVGGFVYGGFWLYNLSMIYQVAIAFTLLWCWNRGRFRFGTVHGSARWAKATELQADGFFGAEGLLLGRYREHKSSFFEALTQLITGSLADSDSICRGFITAITGGRINLSRSSGGPLIRVPPRQYVNIITVAPAGAGKGVGTVVPNLLNYPNSVVVTDVKGENFKLTAEHRKANGQRIVVLDPFGISGKTSSTLNPLDLIAVDSPTLMEDVRSMADALVIRTAKDTDPHWNESASNLLYAVILLVVVECKGEERTLDKVRLTLSDQEELQAALEFMKGSDALDGMLARAAGTILSMPEKEFGSVLSSANRHTNFLDSPLIRANTAATSFPIRSIAKTPTSVYLILPAQYIFSHSRLMLLWINSFLLVVKQAGASEENEILLMLDEVAQLGEIQSLEHAITLLRGFGLRLWFIVQSLAQLEVAFPGPRAKVILSNCGIQQFFGVSDIDTATYISKYIGTQTVAAPNYQSGFNSGTSFAERVSRSTGTSRGVSHGPIQRELIKPEEVLRERNGVFILQQGRSPILGSRLTYYEDADLDPGLAASTPRPTSLVSYLFAAVGVVICLNFAGQHVRPGAWFARIPADPPRPGAWNTQSFTNSQAPTPTRQVPPPQPSGRMPVAGRGHAPPPVKARPTHAVCPKCQNTDSLPSDYDGEELTCPKCGGVFVVPLDR